MDLDKVIELLRALSRTGADYVLVGGVAMGFHGLVRATEDVDLFVRVDAENIERVKRALRSVWDDPAIDEIAEADLAGDYPVVRYAPPGTAIVIDVIARLGEAVRYEDLAVEEKLVDGVSVRLATPGTLYRMKRDTLRPIDQADAAALRRRFGLEP